MIEINKTIIDTKNRPYYRSGSYIDYKNLKIMKPRVYFESTEKSPTIQYRNNRNNLDRFYISPLDGKLITNGERVNVFCSTNLDDTQGLGNTTNNLYTLRTSNFDDGFYLNKSRNYSYDKMNNSGYHIHFPEYRTRRVNRYNKDYFKDELDKINDLLFSKSHYKKFY